MDMAHFRSRMSLDEKLVSAVQDGQDLTSLLQKFDNIYNRVIYPHKQHFHALLLCEAIHHHRKDLFDHLLSQRLAENNGTSTVPQSALHVACNLGEPYYIEELLNAEHIKDTVNVKTQLDVKGTGRVHQNAVEYLLQHDNVDLMLKIMPYYDETQNENQTILHIACDQNAIKCIQYILENNICEVNAPDCHGYPAMWQAVRHGVKPVKLLLDHGANVSTPKIISGYPIPLLVKILDPFQYHNPRIFLPTGTHVVLQTLIDRGADPLERMEGYISPMHQLCKQIDIVEYSSSLPDKNCDLLFQEHTLEIQECCKIIFGAIEQKFQSAERSEIAHFLPPAAFPFTSAYLRQVQVFTNKKYRAQHEIEKGFLAYVHAIKLATALTQIQILHTKELYDIAHKLGRPNTVCLMEISHFNMMKYLWENHTHNMSFYKGDWSPFLDAYQELSNCMLSLSAPEKLANGILKNSNTFKDLCRHWDLYGPILNMVIESCSNKDYPKIASMQRNAITDLIKKDKNANEIQNDSPNEETVMYPLCDMPRNLRNSARWVVFNSLNYPQEKSVQHLAIPETIKKIIMLK